MNTRFLAVGRVAIAGLLLAGAAILVTSCSLPQAQPDLTRYFVLTTRPAVNPPVEKSAGAPRVFVRSVSVPEFLRIRTIVVRTGGNEIRFVDDARWAEPLESALLRVLREDINGSTDVQGVLRPTDEHDFEIALQVRACEGVLPAGVARLAARVEILSAGADAKLIAQDEVSIDVPGWDGKDFAQLAAKLSTAASSVADRLAALVPRKNP